MKVTTKDTREIHKEVSQTIDKKFDEFIDITVKGHGIPLHLDLKDPDQVETNLGVVSVGQEVSKVVPVINRS